MITAAANRPLKENALAHAVALIKEFEGCHLDAYPDPGTGGDPWTIGWGSTGPGIRKGVKWTQAQADERLAQDVDRFLTGVFAAINKATVTPSPAELGAMTSLAYNIGLRAFEQSTLLRLYNAGNRAGAAAQFLRWNRAGGKVMRGLTRRREAEKALFERPKPDFSNVISGANTVPRSS
jgi:lysozyme